MILLTCTRKFYKWLLLLLLLHHNGFSQYTFNVREYGALGDKNELATVPIQETIDACHAQGGGVVFFPAGDYLSGTIVIKSNVTLHLGQGATLFASRDTADYQVPFDIYKHNNPHQPVLIYAENAQNISIEGKGSIHGQARRVYRELSSVDNFIAEETENARLAGVEMKTYAKIPPFVSLVYFVSCQDVVIRNIRLIESVSWTLHLQWCERVNIWGCRIESSLKAGVNSDGIDIDGCRNVTISDCIVATGDDAIVLKSTLTNNRHEDCENIVVTNCLLTSTSSALKIGTETYGDFRHILFSNCTIENSNRGVGIIVRDGGTVSDVIVSNISMDLNRKHFNWWGNADPFWLVVLKRNQTSKVGIIKDVVLSNILAHGQGTSKIEGYNGESIQNISLHHIQLHMHPEDTPDKRATHAFLGKYVKGLAINEMSIHWDETHTEEKWQSALAFSNVSSLTIDGLRGRQGQRLSNDPVVDLHNVKYVSVQGVEPDIPIEVLVRVSGQQTNSISFSNNDVHHLANQKIVRAP